MDDLDHSMHISNHDWLSFFEESEECRVLHAALACPDSSGLSDADDLDLTTQIYTSIKEQQAGEDAEGPGLIEEEGSSVDSKGGRDGLKSKPDPAKSRLSCAEKERWFVSIDNGTSQHLAPATAPVAKKKRKQKKTCKVDISDKVDICASIENMEPVKLLQQNCSNTENLETNTNTTCLEYKEGSMDHSDKEMTSPSISVKSDTSENQVKSSETTQIQPNSEFTCIGVSFMENSLALQNSDEESEIKRDTCNEATKRNTTLDFVFEQGKDRDVNSDSDQNKLGIVLQSLQESSRKGSEVINSSIPYLKDSCRKENVHELLIENTKLLTAFGLAASITESRASLEELPSIYQVACLGESRNEDFDLTLENVLKMRADSGKPIETSHTNSIESDEFADYETYSSSSYDSEAYHSAVESVGDHGSLSTPNSPCILSLHMNDSVIERDRNVTDRSFKPDSSLPCIDLSQTIPLAASTADSPINDSSICNSSLSVDISTSADNSSASFRQRSESILQVDVNMQSPEAYARATGNTQPVYAISAFWDEMEKLTINDILQIRMGRCMLPIEETMTTDEKICKDIASSDNVDLDIADSDYSTNRDESKPDRSSCDFSSSDFEEEYWQFINSSRSTTPDHYNKSYQREHSDCVSKGEESDELGTPVPSKDSPGQTLCESIPNSHELAVPQQLRKNKSMYDIHAPGSMEDFLSQTFLDQSSCMSLEKPLKVIDGFEVATPITCLTEKLYQISFPQLFENLFDANLAKCGAMSVSVYGLQGNYASLTNSYTFCAATNDRPLMPCSEEPIPIFTCSHPTIRELTFPKPGCIFLGTNYTTMKNVSPIQIVSQSILRGMDCKHADRSYSFSQDLSSLHSVKKICFLDKGCDEWRCTPEEEQMPVDIGSNAVVRDRGDLAIKMLKQAAIRQISMENNQVPSDYQSIFSTIKQSDMCLVCIAFASWVLRSSDPEAADAWKAALLANVSALSAIQYLRQYMKKKASP
ncbi:unnamed protein product [Knipowitschia caucasica]